MTRARHASLARLAIAAAVVASIAETRTARAAGDDVATAQVLFEDGKRLMTSGRWDDACPKLAESQRLAPAIGTEFNLADCLEHEGRLASAWAAFLEVVDQTHKRGESQRETAARARADALEAKLGRLTIQVAARAPDLEVRRDGVLVRPEVWGVAMPIDAGEHRVDARAKGRASWSGTVRTKNGQSAALSVPELAYAPASAAAATPEAPSVDATPTSAPSSSPAPTPAPASSPDHTAAALVLGSAVLFAGVGALGLVEHGSNISAYNNDASCPAIDATSRSAQCEGYVSGASTWNTVGIIGFVGSGAALIAGAALWVLAPNRPATTATSTVTCVPGIGTIACGGVF
jgi:hypothetical protein